jgi:hypothetical protein
MVPDSSTSDLEAKRRAYAFESTCAYSTQHNIYNIVDIQ